MGKRTVGLHIVTLLAIGIFCFLALGSTQSTPKAAPGGTIVVSSTTTSVGNVYNIPGPDGSPAGKDYDTLGLVFATSETKFDEKGNEISSQEGIVTMLLREAKKLGGDDILNLRVDENVTWIQSSTEASGNTASKSVMTKNVTYTGSALAIKYNGKSAPIPPAPAAGGAPVTINVGKQ